MAALVPTTITGVKRQFTGSRIETWRAATGDASYPTGGWPITAANCGLSSVKVGGLGKITAGFSAAFAFCDVLKQTDGSIKLRLRAAAGTEVPNATDCSSVTMHFQVSGLGA